MTKNILIVPILLAQLAFTPNVLAQEAASTPQLDSISKLGELNATALQCSYVEQMQRIKQALILNLPKQRALGDWFENSTNTAFLSFISGGNNCGSLAIFTLKVDEAVIELENVFKN